MMATSTPKTWSDICLGVGCDRKEQCRRYTYYLLVVAIAVEGDHLFTHKNRCVMARASGHNSAFIDINDDVWALAPTWWA